MKVVYFAVSCILYSKYNKTGSVRWTGTQDLPLKVVLFKSLTTLCYLFVTLSAGDVYTNASSQCHSKLFWNM